MKKLLLALMLLIPFIGHADEARLLRFPSVGGDQIAFTYAGDLYTVSVNGGLAKKITSDVGYEVFSRFSPDGKSIAFTGQYDGSTEVYTIPVEGGVPKRLTYTATLDRDLIGDRMGPNNIVMGWTPDGKSIYFRSRWYAFSASRGVLMKVSKDGGPVEQFPLTEGGFSSYSPDGKYFAFNRMFREFRTWKYYTGGQADDIWINKVGTTDLEKITDNIHQNIFPMWVGKEIFFISDRDHTMNLFSYNTETKQETKVTDFTDFDIKYPSHSQDYIVFENGGYIYKFDVKSRKLDKVKIEIVDNNLYSRSKLVDASGRISSYSLSPDGERVLVAARGDVYSLPAKEGATYNLTRTQGAHERDAKWSPDGKYIAYFSDKSGEYQLYLMDYDKPESAKAVTNLKTGYPAGLTWSPDSKKIYFQTEKNELYSVDVATQKANKIYTCEYSGIRGLDISNDGAWLAFSTESDQRTSVIQLFEVATGKYFPVTTAWFDSSNPVFSEDGKYLFFTSARDFRSTYSRVEWNATYAISSYAFVLPLAINTPNPTTLKGDEYNPQSKESANAPAASKSAGVTSVKVDRDGIIERATILPLPSGQYQLIAAFGDNLYYFDRTELKRLSLKDMKSNSITKARPMAINPITKKAIFREGQKSYVATLGTSVKLDEAIPTNDIKAVVDYQQEWRQIFNESWRIYRDHFYVENMHGADWKAIHKKYEALLPYVNHRHDLTYVIGEMISELNVGHAYITSGEAPAPQRIKTGLLGGKFSRDKSGNFKIEKIFKGANWDKSLISPLDAAGVDVKVGEYITAVDGILAPELSDIYEGLVGKVGSVVALRVNSSATDKGARTVYVKPIADESKLAYYEWVQNNIKKVEEASGGQIGYIHVPDMSTAGLDEFTKFFYTQLDKKALIIDDRMNGGGNVSPMILERLYREVFRISMSRNGRNQPVPNETHWGPKVCLVDKYSMSDGDLFPQGFKQLGIGKIIGTRTWGGIVGISGSRPFMDGQDLRTPFFTQYDVNGEWMLESWGVEPDIVVDINPFEDFLGKDAQLDKAIEVLLEELKDWKPLPATPKDPIRVKQTK